MRAETMKGCFKVANLLLNWIFNHLIERHPGAKGFLYKIFCFKTRTIILQGLSFSLCMLLDLGNCLADKYYQRDLCKRGHLNKTGWPFLRSYCTGAP